MARTRSSRPDLRLTMPADHGKPPVALLARIRDRLEQNIYVKDILEEVVAAELIDNEDREKLERIRSNGRCFEELLTMIDKRSRPSTMEIFVACLDRARYPHAAELVRKEIELLTKYTEDGARHRNLKIGMIPAQPDNYIVRDEYLCKIKNAVIKEAQLHESRTNHATRWILIHGMPGNGKSYLAGAVLRSPDVQRTCFESGVFWLDIGKPGKEKLLIKLGMLLQMVDPKLQGTPSSLFPASSAYESIIPRLASIFATQFPNSAVVLDDVWDEEILSTFQKIACKCIIVTSRKADIAKVLGMKVAKVEIDSGFTETESQQYFAKILEKDVRELPKEAVLIHEECEGAPMIMSLIGGLLRDNPQRWQMYYRKLKEMPQKIIGMPDDQNRTVEDTIALSVENLKDDLKEKFFDFALFDDDVPIPIFVFQTLWGYSQIEDLEDEMACFVNSSLCTREYCPVRNCLLYRFHDLILHYVRKNIPVPNSASLTEQQKEDARQGLLRDKHRKLFYKYHVACGGKLEFLADDYYIHSFIGYHMSQGRMLADLQEVYGNDRFLKKRLDFVGPEVVLVDIKLLKYQHPFMTAILKKIEEQLKLEYKIQSPKSNRRSTVMEDFLTTHHSRRGSESDVNSHMVGNPMWPASPPSDSKIPRMRSSSSELPNVRSRLFHPESAPAELVNLEFLSLDNVENEDDGITFSTHKDLSPVQTVPSRKLSMRNDLRNDNFGEGD